MASAPAAAAQAPPQTGGAPASTLRASNSSTFSKEGRETPLDEEKASQAVSIEEDIGVARIEALYLVFGKGWKIWLLYISIGLIAYTYSLAENTTSTYLAFATSAFSKHSLLGAISTATSVLGGVSKPFIAKLSDITSRPHAYSVSLVFYVVGFAVIASSNGVSAVAAGELLLTVGATGLDLVTDIIVADITPLEWRGFATALPSSPYIINAFVSGFITESVGEDGWRWGYGIFCIVVPVAMAPALVVLFGADHRAKQLGALSLASSSYARRAAIEQQERQTWWQMSAYYFSIIDGIGLVLLGASWTLILLPFTLQSTVRGGWSNSSLIAMETVGWVLLPAFFAWEKWGSKTPLCPARVWNRTFICCVIIDVFYFVSGNLRSLYYLSWVYVVKEWSFRNFTFFSNTSTVGLCVFGLLAGLIQRVTHRYKYLQIAGLSIRIIGMGLTFWARGDRASDGALVMTQILIALGGAFSVVGSRVASQASVPHQDLATVIALLSLWTKLGGAVGYAISTSIWQQRMPVNLQRHLGPYMTSAEIKGIFGSIRKARLLDPVRRAQAILAYDETVYHIYLPALILSFIPLLAGFLTSDFYLGTQHNAVESKEVIVMNEEERRAKEAEFLKREAMEGAASERERRVDRV